MKHGYAIPAVILSGVLFASGNAHGVDYSVKPVLTSRIEGDTNRRLFSDGGEDVGAAILEYEARIKAQAPRYTWAAKPKVRAQQFSNAQNPDREELILDVNAQHQLPRIALYASGNVERRSAIDSELTQTGFQFNNLNRDQVSIGPGINYQYSPRVSLAANGFWQDVNFEENDNGLLDFSYWSGSIGGEYQLDPVTKLNSRLTFSRFTSPSTNGATDTYTAWMGWSGAFSRTLDAELQLGVTYSDLAFDTLTVVQIPGLGQVLQTAPETKQEVGYVVDAAFTKQLRYTMAKLAYRRSLSPSGRGAQSISDEYEVTVSRELTPKVDGRFRFRFIEQNAEAQDIAILDLEYIDWDLTLLWRISRRLTVGTRYNFSRRVFLNGTATSHRVGFQVNYEFNELRF